ncbi:MAG: carbohydrate ABC transporter permease [Proteobacteria bacterium]|nr:carbohydrate ABC transporter permease [Pseudomonadota bacterium]
MKTRSKLLVHAALITVSLIMLTPIYWVLKTSLTGENLFTYPPSILPVDPNLYYYVEAWYSVSFLRLFFNSVVVALIVVAANLVLNAMAGYALTKQFPGKPLVLGFLLASMMIPFHATIIPAYLLTSQLGLLDSKLGIALPALSHIVCIFLFKSNFEAVPASLIHAARIDGLSEWQILTRILLPLSKPAVATNVILSFIWSWNEFLWPLLVVRSPGQQTMPLGLVAFLASFEDTTGALYAFCVLVVLPGLLVFLLAQRDFIRGLTSGAAKG